MTKVMHAAAHRGGPFGRNTDAALVRAECEGAAPGTEFRFASATESSPIRGGAQTRRASSKGMALALATVCLAIAAWHAGDAAYLHAKAWLGQRLLLDAWNQAKARGTAVKPWPWADTHPVARLTVPAYRIELLVLAGASGRTLAWGPGHVEGSAAPGAQGNAIVTAHRDTHFTFLRELVPGDRIVVETRAGTARRYRVERSVIADYRGLKLPADDRSTTLALVTCYPFDAVDPGTPLRYAVIARGE
jgi:sortase A